MTLPAGDIASNPYWKRDNRRNYPALSTVTQQDVVGLLELGSKAAPRIAAGEAGQKQLVEVKQGSVVLAEVLKQKSTNSQVLAKEVLGENGLPPLPGQGMIWVIDDKEGYSSEWVNPFSQRNFSGSSHVDTCAISIATLVEASNKQQRTKQEFFSLE